MESVTILGLVAGACTTLAFLPQVIKTWRRRSASDLSLLTFAVFSAGVVMWLVYGVLMGDVPLIIANGLTLVLAVAILYLKFRYP